MGIFTIFIIIIVSSYVLRFLKNSPLVDQERHEKRYQYKRKGFSLTRAEHECYDALISAVGKEFYIFPQVHLASLLDNKIVGQNWRAALAHINRKSVDFVLCDKAYISPKLAI